MDYEEKVFAVILAAAAICGSLSPVYAADSELVLYTWEGMFPQEVLDGFEEETGCKIVYSNFDTDETMLEKVSMAKGGDYDVVIADDYILEKIVEEGLATKLDKDKSPIGETSILFIRDSFMMRRTSTPYHMVQVFR